MTEDKHMFKRHNKTLLLYHIVFPVKYRRSALTPAIENTLKDLCLEIGIGYEMNFIEIGADDNHIHFLIQGMPNMSVTEMVTKIKSITARGIFKKHPEIKQMLWGGNFWTSGFYANTVGQYSNESMIKKYIKEQSVNYKKIYEEQLTLF